jgi:hypothetical protein
MRWLLSLAFAVALASVWVTDEPYTLTSVFLVPTSQPDASSKITQIPWTITSIYKTTVLSSSYLTSCIDFKFMQEVRGGPTRACSTDKNFFSIVKNVEDRTDVITTLTETTETVWDAVTLTQTSTIISHHSTAHSSPPTAGSSPSPFAPTPTVTPAPDTQTSQVVSTGLIATFSVMTESISEAQNAVLTKTSTMYFSPVSSGR